MRVKIVMTTVLIMTAIIITFLNFGGSTADNGTRNQKKDNSGISFSTEYNSVTDRSISENHTINPLLEINYSPNREWTIFSRVNHGESPNLYLSHNNEEVNLTNDIFIPFHPVVNDNGDYAYALSEYNASESQVYINQRLIQETKESRLLYKNLALNNDYLVFIEERFYDNKNFIITYNLENQNFKRYTIQDEIYLQVIDFIEDTKLIIQAYDLKSNSMNIYTYDIEKNSMELFLASEKDLLIKKIDKENDEIIIDEIGGDVEARLIHNAYYSLNNYQFSEPFSKSNDFIGRISWNQSYRLELMLGLYQKTQDEIVIENLNQSIRDLLSITNADLGIAGQFNPPFLWASKKYSSDKETPISLMINNARILYPMLVAVNQGYVEGDVVNNQILDAAIDMSQYFEKYYDQDERLYKFPEEIDFWADGIWLPYNQQNAFGLVLIELYKATGDEWYRNRVTEMAKKFKSEFVYPEDGRVLWHYWPQMFYNGWVEEDEISINTPSSAPREDQLYEDISHAGLNVKFILEYMKVFGGAVFTESDIIKLNNTIETIIIDGSFARFMGGDTEVSAPHYRYLPAYGWSELGNEQLNKWYLTLVPLIYPHFDSQKGYVYINSINYNKMKEVNQSELKVKRLHFDSSTLYEKQKDIIKIKYSEIGEIFYEGSAR